MKRQLTFLLAMVMILSTLLGNATVASAATSFKLTKRESTILKAWVRSTEEQDLTYLNKYKYPGMVYKLADYGDFEVKMFNVKYSKAYDKTKKMYYGTASAVLIASDGERLGVTKIKMGLFFRTKGKVTYSYLENDKAVKTTVVTDSTQLSDDVWSQIYWYLTEKYGQDAADSLLDTVY